MTKSTEQDREKARLMVEGWIDEHRGTTAASASAQDHLARRIAQALADTRAEAKREQRHT